MALNPEAVPRQSLGSLQSCLVEGDPEQRARERRVRRKALISSVLLQASALATLILVPLFAKPERLVREIATPVPPYRHVAARSQNPQEPPNRFRRVCITCFNSRPTNLSRNERTEAVQPIDPLGNGPSDSSIAIPCAGFGCIDIRTEGPKKPVQQEVQHEKPRIVLTQISAAMLTHRVEPVYPTLARQLGRPGRVELRAVIATDGTIQSLQVVSGDPLFYQSAMDAVRQWRYRATVLNGEAVEVDTFITVIYNISR
jgi:TonB family protein